MAAASLRIPDELKRRIDALAAGARKTPHAFMVEAVAREAERLELRERFAAESAASEAEALQGGKSIALDSAFDYLEKRASGQKSRRPRARPGRASR